MIPSTSQLVYSNQSNDQNKKIKYIKSVRLGNVYNSLKSPMFIYFID